MTRFRLGISLIAIGLASLGVGAATAWFSDSGTIQFDILAAVDFGHHDEEANVWVCKLVGPPDSPSLAPGKNPIHVSSNAVDAEEGFSDAHPSYVVEHGDVECVVPAPDEPGTSEVSGLLPEVTTTTTTSSSTTTTTTTTAPEAETTTTTTTTAPEVETTTTTGPETGTTTGG